MENKMRLNKPIITISLIIVMAFTIVSFSLSLIGRSLNNRKVLKSVVNNFLFYNYVINDEDVINSTNYYKYPIEVFDYIDYKEVNKVKYEFVDNYINGKETTIDSNKISKILKDSVSKYEEENNIDTFGNVNSDIEKISIKINEFFGEEFSQSSKFFKMFSSNLVIDITVIIIIAISVGIIVTEKRTGLLICSIVYISYSFLLYYLNNNFFTKTLLYLDNKYFYNMQAVSLKLDNTYMICFILGFVLLLIYIYKLIKKYLRDLRLYSYGYYWR
jgi:hypothetical protein